MHRNGYFIMCTISLCGSSEERGAFSRNATETWVEGGDLPLVCRAAPLLDDHNVDMLIKSIGQH